MMALELRPLRPEETSLLLRATLGNMNWCGERFAMDDVLSRPEFSHYVTIRPERGDFGVVAEVDGNPIRSAGPSSCRRMTPGTASSMSRRLRQACGCHAMPEAKVWGAACFKRLSPRQRLGDLARSACPWSLTISPSSSTALSDSRTLLAVRATASCCCLCSS